MTSDAATEASPREQTIAASRAGLDASDAGAADTTPLMPSGWILAVAFGCIVLGLGGLAYFGLSR